MRTAEAVLRGAIDGAGGERVVTLDPAFQGLPDTAHGGSVLALFDAVGAVAGPRGIVGRYRRRVPLGVPLRLALAREGDALVCRLREDTGSLLVDGRVASSPSISSPSAAGGAVEGGPIPGPGEPLPVSRACFACGVDNPLGLRVSLAFDADAVWTAWQPRDELRAGDGVLATIAITTLLDEAAFWLGALATGESGMTTELQVALHRPPPAGAVVVRGERASVRPWPDDARYRDTRVAAYGADGALVATASITFVAVRGAARRLVRGMLAMNPPDVVRRVFPAYAH